MYSYYKDANNVVFAYDENQTPKQGLIAITEQEKDEIHKKQRDDEFNSLPYDVKRKMEYPSIGDQLDALFHAGLFPDEMAKKIKAIKDKYKK